MPFSTIRKEHGSFLPETKASSPVACFGMAMKRRAGLIKLIQWGMMLFYLFVLLMPLVFPERILFWHNLQALSVFVFWGCGWPLVMLSTMIFGRIWCGVFCPDGTLTETISHYGKKRSIPRWIRWRGWSCLTLILYTLALFLSGATQNHTSTTILLGSLTLASALTGFLYGSGIIIKESQTGILSKKDVFCAVTFIGIAHALIEDTLLMVLIGGVISGTLGMRMLFAIVFSLLITRIYIALTPKL